MRKLRRPELFTKQTLKRPHLVAFVEQLRVFAFKGRFFIVPQHPIYPGSIAFFKGFHKRLSAAPAASFGRRTDATSRSRSNNPGSRLSRYIASLPVLS